MPVRVWEIHMESDVSEEKGKMVLVETVCIKYLRADRRKWQRAKQELINAWARGLLPLQ